MSEATALAVLEKHVDGETPSALMRRATDVAGVCREIVTRTAMDLKGKKYVRVEGWMSIAAAYGCVPSIREVEDTEAGTRAVAELRRHDGAVIAAAEGFVGLDEPKWANGPAYARRGMAQTRAISRVCRSVFAFCVVLIDENLETTPAEEIPGVTVDVAPQAPASAVPLPAKRGARSSATKIPYGKNKDKHLEDVSDADLAWLLNAATKSATSGPEQYRSRDEAWLRTVQAEAQSRVGATGKVSAPATTSPRKAAPARKQAQPVDEVPFPTDADYIP